MGRDAVGSCRLRVESLAAYEVLVFEIFSRVVG
jgi:hypothetical protein